MTVIDYIFALVLSFILAGFLTPAVIWFAKKIKVLDYPKKERKIHKKPIPLLGGLAIFLAINISIVIYYFFSSSLVYDNLVPKFLLGIIIGGFFVMIGGFLDDKFDLNPKYQILFPVAAILAVIVSGVGIDQMTNPFSGGLFHLDKYVTILFWFKGLPYKFTLLADLFTLIWMLLMMYTTKLLDGLDGLVSGVSVVGGLFIFITALMNDTAQPDVAMLAMIIIGSFLAFLIFNFNPAKIFLGEGGSLYSGFMLGVLSIISGSKVAVTLIVMGIPVLDMLWTIIRRLMEGKNPLRTADRKHLHFRLLDAGLSVRQSVFILYIISIIFGLAALFLQKISLGLTILGMMVILTFIIMSGYLYKIRKEKEKGALDIS